MRFARPGPSPHDPLQPPTAQALSSAVRSSGILACFSTSRRKTHTYTTAATTTKMAILPHGSAAQRRVPHHSSHNTPALTPFTRHQQGQYQQGQWPRTGSRVWGCVLGLSMAWVLRGCRESAGVFRPWLCRWVYFFFVFVGARSVGQSAPSRRHFGALLEFTRTTCREANK